MEITLKDVIWPVTVIILFLLFYKPISKLVESITALRRKGVEIDFGKPSQQKQVIEPDMKLEAEFDPTVISNIEKRVEEDLNLKNVEDIEEKIRRLKKYATIKEITTIYLNLYLIIYGSQLRLLQYLNFRRGIGETKENLKKQIGGQIRRIARCTINASCPGIINMPPIKLLGQTVNSHNGADYNGRSY